jgi:glyoxylase-like metal-dependent hydrolase (beta-lactamase superfamily II)
LRTVVTPGHTPGHQSILIEDGKNPPVFFVSDLASYAVHFAKTAWVTAYDVEPLVTIETKEKWQPWAYENQALVVFQHDCTIRSAKLVKNEKEQYEIEVLEKGSIKNG